MTNKDLHTDKTDSKEQEVKKEHKKDIDAQRDPDKNDPPKSK